MCIAHLVPQKLCLYRTPGPVAFQERSGLSQGQIWTRTRYICTVDLELRGLAFIGGECFKLKVQGSRKISCKMPFLIGGLVSRVLTMSLEGRALTSLACVQSAASRRALGVRS
jgi:hypothetical protein